MNWNDNRNLTMLVDFYELTMSNGYFEQGCGDRMTVLPEDPRRRRICHLRRLRAAHRLCKEPSLYRGRHRLFAEQEAVQ